MYAETDSEIPFVYCPPKKIGASVWVCDQSDCDGTHHYYRAV